MFRAKGLAGASPLLLSEAFQEEAAEEHGDGQRKHESELGEKELPSTHVLQQSEFLLPLDSETMEMYALAMSR